MSDHPANGAAPTADDGATLVVIARRRDVFGAELLAVRLRDAEIDAFVFPAERGWTGGVGFAETRGGVPVWIRESDVDRAQAVLESPVADPTDDAEAAAHPMSDQIDDERPTYEAGPRPLVVTAGMVFAAVVIVVGLVVAVMVMLGG